MSEDYHFQLAQVVEALERDPDNADLQKLRQDLTELISLMGFAASNSSSSASAPPATDASSAPSKTDKKRPHSDATDNSLKTSRWIKGQTVLAKYQKDDKMYEAVVEAVPSESSEFYTVIFKGYTSREKVAPENVRDFDPTQVAKPLAAVAGGVANKRNHVPKATLAAFSNGTDRASKRKRTNLEYHEHIKQKEEEQLTKQSAWQKFAVGGKKAALKTTAPLKKTSMFATPDDPTAKVGVVGGGKGMTHFQQRGKHVYERTE